MQPIPFAIVPVLLACVATTASIRGDDDTDAGRAPVPVQHQEDPDRAAVERAARDYATGFFSRDVDRVDRALYRGVRRVTVEKVAWGAKMPMEMDGQTLLELTRLGGGRGVGESTEVSVEVLGVSGNVASVRIDCEEFLDYAHLLKLNDEWRIVSLLGQAHGKRKREAGPEALAAIEKVAFEYVDGYYAIEADRMGGAMHPRMRKLNVERRPNGREYVGSTTPEFQIERTRTKTAALPEKNREIEIVVEHATPAVADVTVRSKLLIQYLHLTRAEDEWKIVDEVWVSR